jgi:hypothetical protein
VFEQAAAGAEPLRLPVAAAIAEGRGALQVHWFPQEKQA